jgi:hypothetical protein
MVWLADGWLYYVALGDSGDVDELWRTGIRMESEPVPVEGVPECGRPVRIRSLFRVGEHLGLAVVCGSAKDTLLVSFSTGRAFELLGKVPLEIGSVASVRGDLFYADNLLGRCSRLLVADANGFTWLDVEDVQDWLTVEFRDNRHVGSPCDDKDAAGLPSVTADGDRMAFFAIPDGNKSAGDGLWAKATLYYGRVGGPATALTHNIDRPIDTDVSPNGKVVVFSAHYRASGGVWLVEASSSKLHFAASGRYGRVAVSPDSQRVATVEFDPPNGGHVLRLLDIDIVGNV